MSKNTYCELLLAIVVVADDVSLLAVIGGIGGGGAGAEVACAFAFDAAAGFVFRSAMNLERHGSLKSESSGLFDTYFCDFLHKRPMFYYLQKFRPQML